MQKITRTNLTLFLCLVVFSLSYGQEDRSVINVMKICGQEIGGTGGDPFGCGPGTFPATMNAQCTGNIYPSIYLTNVAENPVEGEYYSLPEGIAPIFINHQFSDDEWIVSGPYTGAKSIGLQNSASGDLVEVFEIELMLEVEVKAANCVNQQPGQPYIVNRTVEMVTPARSGENLWMLYPIHSFSTPSSIFSCEDFYDTWCDCHLNNPDGSPCDETPIPPIYDLAVCVDCGDCGNPEPPVEHPQDPISNTNYRLADPGSMIAQTEVLLAPNPFADEFSIKAEVPAESQINFSLYNATGQRVLQQTGFSPNGQYQTKISTTDLPSGIYYFYFQHNEKQIVQKLLRL